MTIEQAKQAIKVCPEHYCTSCPVEEIPYECTCDDVVTILKDLVGEYEERIAIMQESMEALEKRCNALDALEQRCKTLEQRNEPIEPIVVPIGEDVSVPFIRYKCPKCGMFQIEFKPNYCSGCGQAVKWE